LCHANSFGSRGKAAVFRYRKKIFDLARFHIETVFLNVTIAFRYGNIPNPYLTL
jgi:hypothetical protein